ncbi:hypothetical protein [Nonomuraea turcica]|uniref:hypothetical protein n=1 Tax=Nonomuraea sp. G32 TaxID=3067274 RepID=UPI00273CE2E1|nr:hypothetical protein [Nonomuraea sp. G32]MDP4512109.1 hypothetical protein [Nonomuraea sp. G32]
MRVAFPVPMPLAAQPPTHPHHRRADAIGPPIDRWWLAELPELPPPLPARASAAPARADAEPDILPRMVAAPEQLRVATLTWVGSDGRAIRATEASRVRARSWWLWWVQARGLQTSGGRLFVTSCRAPLHRTYTGELRRRSDRWPAIALSGPLSPSVLRRSAAAALIHAGESPAVSRALHGRATGGGIGRAVICNAAQRWDARPPVILAQRMRRYR